MDGNDGDTFYEVLIILAGFVPDDFVVGFMDNINIQPTKGGNKMFLKSKICLTVFSLYEIIAIILLHCQRTCDAMFGSMFCDDHVFKYFIVCVAVPVIVFLILMWIMEIINGTRHRHSLFYKARHAVKDMASNIRDKVSENISPADFEKLLTAALVMGLKKYADRNPRARNIINEIMGGDYAEFDDAEYTEYSDEYNDADDEDEYNNTYSRSRNSETRRPTSSRMGQRSKSAKKKK